MTNNPAWKYKPTSEQLAALLSDDNALKAIKTAARAKLDSEEAERERRELAAAITFSRYGKETGDKRIDETLDEPAERLITTRWLNDDIAQWISEVSIFGWRWAGCQPKDLSGLEWKSQFASFCYGHLA